MLLKSSKKGVSPALASSTGSNTNSIASGDVLLSCELINIGKVSKQKISMSSDDPMFQGWSRNLSSEKRHPTAFVQVYISPDMKKTCVHLSHRTLLEQCRVQAIHCEMLPSTIPEKQLMTRSKPTHRTRCPIVTCVRSYNGLGFVHSVLLGIYVGSLSVIVPPFEYFIRPLVWYETIHNYEGKCILLALSYINFNCITTPST